jgi:glycerol-3-phosphate acyltransferase PlsY
MQIMIVIPALIGAYLLGSIPVGLLIVRLVRGRDIRYWFSGRTGGTNVMRMAGFWSGFVTAVADVAKGYLAVWLGRMLSEGSSWVEIAAGLLAIVGHNYSIFLVQRKEGRLQLHGGAGGATTVGATMGLWLPSVWIIVPMAFIFAYGVGYASMATMSIALTAALIFLWRAITGVGPWAYFVFGVLAEGLLLLALRPNIYRLLKGEERVVGWRARRNRRSR